MDFRTEWWSKLMVVAMILIAAVINPWIVPDTWNAGNALGYLVRILAHPFIAIAIATIPVFIICYFIKKMPDLDYSIWVAFGYMLYLLGKFLIG